MTDYALYLESGPKRRKTMVHVLDLLGCIANGPTTDAALDATPAAIRAFLRFLRRHGDEADPDAPITTHVAEHITQGEWLGNGSPYVTYDPDLNPVTDEEIEVFIQRFRWLREELAAWATAQGDEQLDARPADGGRSGRAILLHLLSPTGAYLSAALGGVTGFNRIVTEAERRQIALPDALLTLEGMAAKRIRATTPEERVTIVQRPKELRTLRKAIRRLLEHDWEHLAELSRRQGGPAL